MNELLLLGLGSNLHDRQKNLNKARQKLEAVGIIQLVSPPAETEPWGIRTEHNFLNQVVGIENCKYRRPEILMEELLKIEANLGRNRSSRAPDRIIDIDILYWGELVYVEDPVIPHPRLHRRGFVLEGLVEVAPSFIHPVFQKNQKQLLRALN